MGVSCGLWYSEDSHHAAAILHQRHFSEAAPFIREYHYLPVM